VFDRFATGDMDVNDEDADVGSAGSDEAEGGADIGFVKEEAVEANEKAGISLVADELKYANGRFGA
jgi:hypothetical protein